MFELHGREVVLSPPHAARLLLLAARRAGTLNVGAIDVGVLRALYDPDQPRDDAGRWTDSGGLSTSTPEFKTWFGDSKVVDESGKPIVVYHRGSFNEEDELALIVGTEGMHFGTKDAADARPVGKGIDDRIKSIDVEQDTETGKWHWSMDGVESSDMDEEGFNFKEDAQENAENAAVDMGENDEWDERDTPLTEAYLNIQNPMRVADQAGDWTAAIAKAKAAGHDGIIYTNRFEDAGSTSYIVFEPTQVKSSRSTGFDPKNPLITLRARKRSLFDPSQPRDESGKWTDGGSSANSAIDALPQADVTGEAKYDPLIDNSDSVRNPLLPKGIDPDEDAITEYVAENYSEVAQEIFAATKDSPGDVRVIPINRIDTQQATLSKEKLKEYASGERNKEEGIAIRYGRRFLLIDGNHRVVAAKMRGETKVRLRVVSDTAKQKNLARRSETPLHAAADAHVAKLSVAVRYAFAVGRKALKKSLPSMRGLAFDPDQPRDDQGQWTSGGGVLSENGEPVVVYHGTDRQFDKFDTVHGGDSLTTNTGAANGVLGVFFTTDDHKAGELYAGNRGRVVEANLVLKTPLRLRGREYEGDASASLNEAAAEHHGKSVESLTENDFREWKDYLVGQGKDGIEVTLHPWRGKSEKDYVVFSPSQIKTLGLRSASRSPEDAAISALAEALESVLPPTLLKVLKAGGDAGLGMLGKQLKAGEELKAAASKIKIDFDVANKNAVAWAKRHAAELIDDIAETSRKRIRAAIVDLASGEDWNEALETILKAVGDDDRADLIARHETMLAASEGQRQGWDQAVEAGLLDENSKRVWIVVGDEKVCPICEDLDGSVADLDGEYEGGYDGPPAHVACRCTEGISA